MPDVPTGADPHTATLVWLLGALARAREEGQERLAGYLEAVADDARCSRRKRPTGARAASPMARPDAPGPRGLRRGARVRVRPGHRAPGLDGMPGVVVERWGSPEHPAFDVRLEDGQRRLFWFHELDADGTRGR